MLLGMSQAGSSVLSEQRVSWVHLKVELDRKREHPNEENTFECLGGGSDDGAQHRPIIGLALLPPLLLPLLLLLLSVTWLRATARSPG